MADLTQSIKYTVEVDASALDRLKTLLDDVATRAKAASDAFTPLAASSAKVARAIMKATEGMTSQTTSAVQLADGLAGLNTKFEELVKMGKIHADSVKQTADGMKAMDKAADGGAQATEKLTKSKKKLKETLDETDKGSGRLMSTWLKMYGVFFSVRSVIQRTYQALKEGAQQVDLDRTLGNQIAGFEKLLEGVRDSTAGMVSDGKLKKSIALMSSFGIPTQRMGESLELVQKMAIRTGQSADFLTESFARGISRLSPLILDNLGIQVSLKDANEAYAVSIGKTTDKLTKAEQITALMNHTLEKMKANTQGVDLESSVGGTVERAKTSRENMWDDFTSRTARSAGQLFAAFGSTSTKMSNAVGHMNDQLVKLKANGASAEAVKQYEAVRDNLVGLARLGLDMDLGALQIFDLANAEGRDCFATKDKRPGPWGPGA
jgi:methyl-accepting chemotaxis protein